MVGRRCSWVHHEGSHGDCRGSIQVTDPETPGKEVTFQGPREKVWLIWPDLPGGLLMVRVAGPGKN